MPMVDVILPALLGHCAGGVVCWSGRAQRRGLQSRALSIGRDSSKSLPASGIHAYRLTRVSIYPESGLAPLNLHTTLCSAALPGQTTPRHASSLQTTSTLSISPHCHFPCTPSPPWPTMMNLSATLNIFRLLTNPSLCLPQATIPTFDQLPHPLAKAFIPSSPNPDPTRQEKPSLNLPDIRAVILDKDNCFAVPKTNTIHPPYLPRFALLRAEFPSARLLIVSNSAGTASDDPGGREAALLERETGVRVLRHATKKPGCGAEILRVLREEAGVRCPSQVVVVGDRLLTDVMMGNLMGARGMWVRDGVVVDRGLVC